MTAITAQIQIEALTELVERQRTARRIAFGSASLTALIGLVAGILAGIA
jgi:hypothetical protein